MKADFGDFGTNLARLRNAQRNHDEQEERDEEEAADQHSEDRRPRLLPPPAVPMAVARVFVGEVTAPDGALMLRYWRGGWWRWRGSHWKEVELRLVRALLYAFTENATYATADGMSPWCPTRKKIDDLVDALIGLCHLASEVEQPSWLDGRESGTIVSCENGLLDVEQRILSAHTAHFFNVAAVPFAFDRRARVPRGWRRFLKALWPRDSQSRVALAQWFGYVVSGQLHHQKIMLLVGPTRAGKGVIARILSALVGRQNVCGPTLASLSGEFGLQPLLGKPLAIISDARLSSRNSNVVVERLLSVSGEDTLTVNVKFKECWSGRLPCRILISSNELPSFKDSSEAIVGRFLVLTLAASWFGKEDTELELRLRSQLAGILNWALMGLEHLEKKGRFTQPDVSSEAISSLRDLASPVRAFVRDACEVHPDAQVLVDDAYAAFVRWADENGHPRISKATFGRDLKAAMPRVRQSQPWCGEVRVRVYVGLRLKPAAGGAYNG